MPALSERKIVEVCYAPSHFPLYNNGFDIVVVIDVLRATSAITTGLHCGIKEIIPINSVEKQSIINRKVILLQQKETVKWWKASTSETLHTPS